MKVVGLTGSIAMGKSEVAQILRSVGVPVFDADGEVHRLYESKEGVDLVRALVPAAVTDEKVDRNILSTELVGNANLLSKLEQHVHGAIKRRRKAFIAQQGLTGAPLVVLDIPLLFETGSEGDVDTTVVVSSSPELQRQRAMARPGMTEAKLAMIMKRQMPDQEKRARADFIIENNGSKDELREAVLSFLEKVEN